MDTEEIVCSMGIIDSPSSADSRICFWILRRGHLRSEKQLFPLAQKYPKIFREEANTMLYYKYRLKSANHEPYLRILIYETDPVDGCISLTLFTAVWQIAPKLTSSQYTFVSLVSTVRNPKKSSQDVFFRSSYKAAIRYCLRPLQSES